MQRRDLLEAAGVLAAGTLAGCSVLTGDWPDVGDQTGGASLAAAAELNVYRARLYDAVALGRADETEGGAAVASAVFERFEGARGEFGAHETLERTDHDAYEGFERALGNLRDRLAAGNVPGATSAAETAAGHLRDAQVALTDEATARVFTAYVYGSRALNAGVLAQIDAIGAASSLLEEIPGAVEGSPVHDALEDANPEAFQRFEHNLTAAREAAEGGDREGVVDGVREAAEGATAGAYALAGANPAGVGHIATLQARGWDAATSSRLAGPGAGLAHAATLALYRARVYDARWLAERGKTDLAVTMVADVFAHFEEAAAHDPLETATPDAYEEFETGLGDLKAALGDGDSAAIDDALGTINDSLVAGIHELAGADAPLLEAAFFRARFADANEQFRLGNATGAAATVEALFARFEADELGLHEAIEETSESLYHTFEEDHLAGLASAYEAGDGAAVETHHEGVLDALSTFVGGHATARASAAAGTSLAARGFDAAVLSVLGEPGRAGTVVTGAFERFEAGANGFHEALEDADHEHYERFEAALGAVRDAAKAGEPVNPESKAVGDTALTGIGAVVAAGGSGDVTDSIVADVFTTFEEARVHEALEEADHGAYEAFEAALGAMADAGASETAAVRFADASRAAQFAVAGAAEKAPDGAGGDRGREDEKGADVDYSGGPNVVDEVPEDADHVVSLRPASFDPATLAVAPGDTVAFEFGGGEPHTVTAYEDDLPEGASYWASCGFDDEAAAIEGWERGEGAIQVDKAYFRTFETVGEHGYYCIPHEAAGMEGTILVEE